MNPDAIAGMDRDQIIGRFAEWLDATLAREAPPAGIDAEILAAIGGDSHENGRETIGSYELWAAMTALSQEVKLQGRAFRELDATLCAEPARIADEIGAAQRERERDIQREAERRCRREVLSSLLDMRDRLERGLASARAGAVALVNALKPSWLARQFGASGNSAALAAIEALIKGYELGLDRLDQMLEDFNARPIRALGQLFDPRCMNAIDKEEAAGVPEGTVLEVYRSGYEWSGEVFRPAQVKVAAPREREE